MRIFKNLVTVLLVVFSIGISSAQSNDAKKLIVNKWVIDQDAMKPVILTMIGMNPQFAALDDATKASTLDMVMAQIANVKVEYKADGTMQKTDQTGDSTGTWSLSADGKELILKTEGKPDKKNSIVELTKTKMNMTTAEGRTIIFKTL